MNGFRAWFGGEDDAFDEYDEFVPDHLPEPGPFLEDQAVLTGPAHVEVHETARELFEEQTVYDVTFDYNLARLNLDRRHENAGFRYAEDAKDPSVLRAEFTPTTPFCPQTSTLVVGAFRAWNGLSERHEYRLVRVRTARMHHRSDDINERLRSCEDEYLETGSIGDPVTGADRVISSTDPPPIDDEPDAPF